MWGENFPAEINVPRIFENLEDEFCKLVCCEGCEMSMIGKHEGRLIMSFFRGEPVEVNLSEYIIPKNKRVKLCQKSERSKPDKLMKDVQSVDKGGCDQPE